MKKLKEINLTVDTSKYSSPHVKGKQPYYQGFSGGMTDSAASAYSSYMGAKKFTMESDEEEITDEEIEMYKEYEKEVIEEIISLRRLSLLEFVELNKDSKNKIIDVETELIGNLLDLAQRTIEALPIPGYFDEIAAAVIDLPGSEHAIGSSIKAIARAHPDSEFNKEETEDILDSIPALSSISSLSSFALPGFPGMPVGNNVIADFTTGIVSRAIAAIGKSTKLTGTVVYSPGIIDMATDFAGDSLAGIVSSAAGTVIPGLGEIPGGVLFIIKNRIEVNSSTKELEALDKKATVESKNESVV